MSKKVASDFLNGAHHLPFLYIITYKYVDMIYIQEVLQTYGIQRILREQVRVYIWWVDILRIKNNLEYDAPETLISNL